jgi:hypothetical protein
MMEAAITNSATTLTIGRRVAWLSWLDGQRGD